MPFIYRPDQSLYISRTALIRPYSCSLPRPTVLIYFLYRPYQFPYTSYQSQTVPVQCLPRPYQLAYMSHAVPIRPYTFPRPTRISSQTFPITSLPLPTHVLYRPDQSTCMYYSVPNSSYAFLISSKKALHISYAVPLSPHNFPIPPLSVPVSFMYSLYKPTYVPNPVPISPSALPQPSLSHLIPS